MILSFFLQISNKNSGNAKKSIKITIIVIKKPYNGAVYPPFLNACHHIVSLSRG